MTQDNRAGARGDTDLAATVDLARRLVGGERASMMVPVGTTPELRVVAASGQASDRLLDQRVRLGQPVAGLVAQTGEPLLAANAEEFAAIVGPRTPRSRSASFISVPVPLAGGRRGVLNVADPIGRTGFQREDLGTLQDLIALQARLAAAEARAAELQKELLWVQESERHRLARDLHDEAGHALTVAIFQIDLERIKPTIPPETKATLTRVRDIVLDCASALSEMAFRLRPRILEDLGLVSALRALIAQMQEAGGVRLELRISGEARVLSPTVELVAFRVVQEALTNIRKHARAERAWVDLDFGAHTLELQIQDDGVGLPDVVAPTGQHVSQGMRGMRERVDSLHGSLTFGSRQPRGTRLVVRLPLEQ